jgi:hypothetical protein
VKTYDYINRVVLMLPLSVYEGTWTHSPLSLLCITMILCVRRNFFEITTFPNKAADEAYMQELRRQHPKLVEAERAIFAGVEGGEVIALSFDDEVEGGEDGGVEGVEVGGEDEEIDVDEWRSGGVSSPTTPTTAPARTRLVAHRT